MCKGLVGFCHTMDVFLLLNGCAATVGRIQQLIGELVHHALFATPARITHDPAFCGGVFDKPRWMPREDILNILAAIGFSEISIYDEQANHPNGPAMSIFARKTLV